MIKSKFVFVYFLFFVCLGNFSAQIPDSLLNKINSKSESIDHKITALMQSGDVLTVAQQYTLAEKLYLAGILLSQKVDNISQTSRCENSIANFYSNQNNLIEALRHFNNNLKLEIQLKNEKKIAGLYNDIALIYEKQNMNNEAILLYNKSLELNIKLKNELWEAYNYKNLGNTYNKMNEMEKSISYHLKALHLFEKLNDYFQCGDIYRIISLHYVKINQLENSLKFARKSAEVYEKANDTLRLSRSFFRIASLFDQKKMLDSVEYYYQKSFELLKGENYETDRAGMINNIGNIYSEKGDHVKAIQYLNDALLINKKYNNTEWIMINYANLAEAHNKLGHKEDARNYFKLTEEMMSKMPQAARDGDGNLNMSQLASDMSDTTKAFRYLKKYVESLNQVDYAGLSQQMSKQLLTYQFEKEKEIEEQKHQSEIKTQKNRLTFGIIILGVVLVFAFALINRIKIISKQKQFIEKQSAVVAEKNKEIIDSINYAQRIQRAMLTADSYIEKELRSANIDHFILFKPKDIVSGDFYWFYKDENYLFYVTADSTGHGVPGGFMSVLGINLLNEIVTDYGISDPGEILNKLREEIIRALKTDEGYSKDGMDAVVCRINLKDKSFSYAASNNSFYLVRDRIIIEQKAQKMPVGYMEEYSPFITKTFDLKKGDFIFTYTDGYADQFGGVKGKKFKYKKLEELVLSNLELNMSIQGEMLAQEFDSWKGNHEQVDDVCIIGMKI